tara:strand:- start:49 stop:756 length:708 start_codon:yes stop_codon:yes gene_type:complete
VRYVGTDVPRIFQIGFNRCGTTSFHLFFEQNGLRSIHWGRGSVAAGIEASRIEGKPLLHYVDGFQVYCDMEFMREDHAGKHISRRPFRKLYNALGEEKISTPIYAYTYFEELDKQYPGSRFILNTREVEGWIRSRRRFLDIGYTFCPHGDGVHGSQDELEGCWRYHWRDHVSSVRGYFSDKPGSLLEYDIHRDEPRQISDFLPELDLDPDKWARHNSYVDGAKNSISEIEWPDFY